MPLLSGLSARQRTVVPCPATAEVTEGLKFTWDPVSSHSNNLQLDGRGRRPTLSYTLVPIGQAVKSREGEADSKLFSLGIFTYF